MFVKILIACFLIALVRETLMVRIIQAQASPTSDWDKGNLIANGDFTEGTVGAIPEGWETVCPNNALAPIFKLIRTGYGNSALMATGNGRRECFGYIRHPVHLEANKTYRLRVRLRFEEMEDLNLNLVHGIFAGGFNDGIFTYCKEGDRVVGDKRFPGPDKPTDGEARLYFRFSAHGKVWWERGCTVKTDYGILHALFPESGPDHHRVPLALANPDRLGLRDFDVGAERESGLASCRPDALGSWRPEP